MSACIYLCRAHIFRATFPNLTHTWLFHLIFYLWSILFQIFIVWLSLPFCSRFVFFANFSFWFLVILTSSGDLLLSFFRWLLSKQLLSQWMICLFSERCTGLTKFYKLFYCFFNHSVYFSTACPTNVWWFRFIFCVSFCICLRFDSLMRIFTDWLLFAFFQTDPKSIFVFLHNYLHTQLATITHSHLLSLLLSLLI